jgi:hypothetical protein
MRVVSKLLAIGGAAGALAIAAPASAQYYPGYGGYGYGYPYGGNVAGGYGYGPNRQVAVNQCASAAQARLGGYGGYGGYGGGRVLGISQILPRPDGGFTIRGVATSGRYGYAAPGQVDLTWRCVTDLRGYIREVTVRPGYGYGSNYTPWNYDYSQFGYRRY